MTPGLARTDLSTTQPVLIAEPAAASARRCKHVGVACRRCKRARRKCTGSRPCVRCIESNQDCVYDEDSDKRRTTALTRKRKIQGLEVQKDALSTILEALRQTDDERAKNLLHLIRQEESLEVLFGYAKQYQRGLSPLTLKPIDSIPGQSQSRRNVMSITALCDEPPFRVPAKPWTTTTDDDTLVSHLMSLYLTWINTAYHIVDQDLFVKSMVDGDLSSPYCSPLLVNAMLAAACQLSDHPMALGEPGNPRTRGKPFFDEAHQLWILQEGIATLSYLQALPALAIAAMELGKGQLVWIYLDNIATCSDELTIRLETATLHGQAWLTPEERRVRVETTRLAIWGAYCARIGLHLFKSANVSVPRVPRPYTSEDDLNTESDWIPYPIQSPRLRIKSHMIFDQTCDIAIAALDIQHLINPDEFGDEQKTSKHTIEQVFGRAREIDCTLTSRHVLLPVHEDLTYLSGTVIPPMLGLSFMCHLSRMVMYVHIMKLPSESEELERKIKQHAKREIHKSAAAVAFVCQRFRRDFGTDCFGPYFSQICTAVSMTIMPDLEEPGIQDVFREMCFVILMCSRRCTYIRAVAGRVSLALRVSGKRVSDETRQLLERMIQGDPTSTDGRAGVRSKAPRFTLPSDVFRNTQNGDLMKKWQTLHIKDVNDDEDSVEDSQST